VTSFERLPGLPPTGPPPEQFSPDGRGHHREGLAVRVTPATGDPWVGNFQRVGTSFDGVFLHPDGNHLLVIAGGQGYVVNPSSRVASTIGQGAIAGVHEIHDSRLLILDLQGLAFEALGPEGTRWRSKRLSWDGFKNVVVSRDAITGEGCLGDFWAEFTLDLHTGAATGGADVSADAAANELLNSGESDRPENLSAREDLKDEVERLLSELHGPRSEDALCSLTGIPEALPLVEEAFTRASDGARRADIVHCMWQFRNPEALPTLALALHDADDRVWKESLDGLVTLGGAASLLVLEGELNRTVPAVKREWIEEAIGQIRDGV
jgi:hypothetical protein